MSLAESLAVASAKLAELTGSPSTETAPVLKAADVLAKIAEELKAGAITKERSDYIASALAELAKNNWQSTTFISIREINDPMQLKPQTVSAPTVQSLDSGTPNSQFATNMSKADKAALMQKLMLDPAQLIEKGMYRDKLEDVIAMFGLSEDDLKDEYELRWRLGDLVKALYQAAQLETLVSKSHAQNPVTKAVDPGRWPLDMASATYDPARKSYVEPEPTWGYDKRS